MKLAALIFAIMVACASADLRKASQPKNGWKVRQRNRKVPFKAQKAYYMEPSAFGYKGLEKQRDGGGYDNFLRSNIDNEQDKRNFKTEDGKDHLPFRSYESAATDAHGSVKNKLPAEGTIEATPGEPFIVPLRWNNPHSSELEANIWIKYEKTYVVVPIRKPACSGEGHKDNVFFFTVPTDFNQLGKRIPGFKGCKAKGQCVLQIYAHSVESRQYAIGVPLKVAGDVPNPTATKLNVQKAGLDVGLDLSKLTRDGKPAYTCLSSEGKAADITNAVPREARLISDVYNHAYQNSDYSPYSGQQPEAISRNLQASCILKMVTGNRGELGKSLLRTRENREKQKFLKSIEKKAKKLVRIYESVVNQMIEEIDDRVINKDDTMPNEQKTAECFRCAEVGAVNSRRLTTNTYVPSFIVDTSKAAIVADVAKYVAPVYDKIFNTKKSGGRVLIYESVLKDMNELFVKASKDYDINYLGPALKDTLATMDDATKFKKINLDTGKTDKGEYAATKAAEAAKNKGTAVSAMTVEKTLKKLLDGEDDVFIADEDDDMSALNADSSCDDDAKYTLQMEEEGIECTSPKAMFTEEGEPVTATMNGAPAGGASVLVTLAAIAVALFAQ